MGMALGIYAVSMLCVAAFIGHVKLCRWLEPILSLSQPAVVTQTVEVAEYVLVLTNEVSVERQDRLLFFIPRDRVVTQVVERVIERPAPLSSPVTDLVYRGTGTVEIGDLLFRGSSSCVTTMPLSVEGAR